MSIDTSVGVCRSVSECVGSVQVSIGVNRCQLTLVSKCRDGAQYGGGYSVGDAMGLGRERLTRGACVCVCVLAYVPRG